MHPVLETVELSEFYYWRQCCGSEFFHPGSRVKKIRIPDLGSASNNLSNFSAKNLFLCSRKYYLGYSSRIPDPDFFPSRSKKSSGSATLVGVDDIQSHRGQTRTGSALLLLSREGRQNVGGGAYLWRCTSGWRWQSWPSPSPQSPPSLPAVPAIHQYTIILFKKRKGITVNTITGFLTGTFLQTGFRWRHFLSQDIDSKCWNQQKTPAFDTLQIYEKFKLLLVTLCFFQICQDPEIKI